MTLSLRVTVNWLTGREQPKPLWPSPWGSWWSDWQWKYNPSLHDLDPEGHGEVIGRASTTQASMTLTLRVTVKWLIGLVQPKLPWPCPWGHSEVIDRASTTQASMTLTLRVTVKWLTGQVQPKPPWPCPWRSWWSDWHGKYNPGLQDLDLEGHGEVIDRASTAQASMTLSLVTHWSVETFNDRLIPSG